ncbi:MAG: ABC transporter substrate-binding protein [Oscillospiraceae bacterium]|jgi:putative ABC transport system substrate-binding protein|nr:ABC transporter substrate-binding protein [Oscillospiraceae bacterium]
MKNFKKILYLLPLALIITFAGCKKEAPIKIGVMQIVEHESLDSARQGFIDELENLGYEDGKNVEFDFQIAGGDLSNCQQIAEKFVNDRKDLIFAISTPCAQSAANSTKDIPIVATAITNYEDSRLIQSNLTGTSDLAPIDKIIELIPKLKLDTQKIGILYSNTDASPQYQAGLAEKKVKEMGLEAKILSVSQAHEVQQVAEKLAKEVDALYVPIDKITFSTMPQISGIFEKQGKFVVCAEDAMISKGAIATYGVDYYELGKMTARQASKILKGEARPENMSIEYLKDFKITLNHELIKKLNLEENIS